MKTSHNCLTIIIVAVLIFCNQTNILYAQKNLPISSRLYNWWPADANTKDIVSGDNGTLENGAGYADGILGLGFNFNSCAQNYIQVPHDNVWGFGTNDFTIGLWVNFRSWNPSGSYSQPDAIFIGDDEGGGDYNKWLFAIHADALTFHINGPAVGEIWLFDTPFTPQTNQWYYLVVTRHGNLFAAYINGQLVDTASNTVSIPNPDAPLTIGQAENLGYINGLMDEITIYRRALSQSEINTIYSSFVRTRFKSNLTKHTNSQFD